jgi:hypothetical protein
MESMSTSDRAKAFISNKLKRTALIILPLAAAAVHCQGGVIFSLDNSSTLNASGQGHATTHVNSPLTGVPISNGVNGISLFGGATYTATASGLGTDGTDPCHNICAGFTAFGNVTGTFDSDSILVNFLFNVTDSNNDSLHWALDVNIDQSGTPDRAEHIATGVTAASGGQVSGSFLLTGLQGHTPSTWFAELEVDFQHSFANGATVTIDIPQGSSVDIGATSGVPEPGTGWLLASAGVTVFGLRKRLLRRSPAASSLVAS